MPDISTLFRLCGNAVHLPPESARRGGSRLRPPWTSWSYAAITLEVGRTTARLHQQRAVLPSEAPPAWIFLMASLRVRPETNRLYIDFYYRGIRCREPTTFFDIPAERRRAEGFLRHLKQAIASGEFRYTDYFPDSRKGLQFDEPAVMATPESEVFCNFVPVWITQMTPQWSTIHLRTVREIVAKHLLPTFGDRALCTIGRTDILAFRAELAQRPGYRGGLTPARINKILCLLRQILHEAAARFAFAPAFQGIKPLKMKRSDIKPFSLAEVKLLVDTIRPDFRAYLVTRFFTGLRTGEINGLRWENVDREQGLILVRETLIAGELEEGTKTERSARDVPMLPLVREAIQSQWDKRDPTCPWVFTTSQGFPIDAKNFNNRIWLPLLKALGLTLRRPYQTRHTAATLMLAAGENPEWVAHILGHANTQMLFKVYSRFVPNVTRQDGTAIARLLTQQWKR